MAQNNKRIGMAMPFRQDTLKFKDHMKFINEHVICIAISGTGFFPSPGPNVVPFRFAASVDAG